MSNIASTKSIAEVLAETEKQKAETARRSAQEYAQRRQAAAQAAAKIAAPARSKPAAGTVNGKARTSSTGTTKPETAAPAQKTDDLRDEFDYALEAVETARKSLGGDIGGIEVMAINLLIKKTGISREDAPRFIRKAINYQNG